MLVGLLPTLWITQDVGAGGGSNRVLRITHNPSVNLGTVRKALLIYMLAVCLSSYSVTSMRPEVTVF